MNQVNDARFMALALALGRRGQGRCWPNPAVGCVIVKDGRIVGRGWTQPGGRPHAEPVALAQAGLQAQGASVYVTLEPCAHHGQTPPCAAALIDAEVARVVIALQDPDPRVDGGGIAMLKAAGIEVQTGCMTPEAAWDHLGFTQQQSFNRPFLTLKLASSFDGRIATASGDSQWITGPAARRLVHLQRATHDAVWVGAGTARADDPSLTVRDLGTGWQPVRVVSARRLDIPEDGNLARSARETPVWLLHGKDAPAHRIAHWTTVGAKLIEVPLGADRQLDPTACVQALAQAGLTRVFCEGGGSLAASVLHAGLVDQLVGFTAGLALGAEGRPSIGALGLSQLAEAERFELIEARALQGDVLHRWRRRDWRAVPD